MDFSLLSKYGISYPASELSNSPSSASQLASKIGFPVAMKVISPKVLHKSDKGGVILGVNSSPEAEKAYHLLMERYKGLPVEGVLVQKMAGKGAVELIIGGKKDAQFGQLIMLGMGGIFVEVFRDVSFRISHTGGGKGAKAGQPGRTLQHAAQGFASPGKGGPNGIRPQPAHG